MLAIWTGLGVALCAFACAIFVLFKVVLKPMGKDFSMVSKADKNIIPEDEAAAQEFCAFLAKGWLYKEMLDNSSANADDTAMKNDFFNFLADVHICAKANSVFYGKHEAV